MSVLLNHILLKVSSYVYVQDWGLMLELDAGATVDIFCVEILFPVSECGKFETTLSVISL